MAPSVSLWAEQPQTRGIREKIGFNLGEFPVLHRLASPRGDGPGPLKNKDRLLTCQAFLPGNRLARKRVGPWIDWVLPGKPGKLSTGVGQPQGIKTRETPGAWPTAVLRVLTLPCPQKSEKGVGGSDSAKKENA